MADRIVVMRSGVIEQVGTPLELYDSPANLFVADFIGSPAMNIFEGAVTPDGFRSSAGLLPLPSAAVGAQQYGVRPEDIHFAASGLDAVVKVIEPTGPETLVILQLGNRPVSVALRERMDLTPGDHVKLAFNRDKVHLFDQNGERVAG